MTSRRAVYVDLTLEEFEWGATIGIQRHLVEQLKAYKRNERRPREDGNRYKFGWSSDIRGACAELAFAKAAGVTWNASLNTYHVPDVGQVQVKSVAYHNGKLMVRDGDKNDPCALVICFNPLRYAVAGWIMGDAGRLIGEEKAPFFNHANTRNKGRPAYAVAQEYLQSLSTLPKEYLVEVTKEAEDVCNDAH